MSPENTSASDQPADRGRQLLSSNALYDQEAVAAFLGASIRTLAQWRADGTGPRFRKIRKRIVYLGHDVNSWVLNEPCAPQRSHQDSEKSS